MVALGSLAIRWWRRRLEAVLQRYPPISRLETDPVSVPRAALRAGRTRSEVEALALFSALLAHGSARQFMAILRRIADAGDHALSRLLHAPPPGWQWPAYRFARGADLCALARAIVRVAERPGGLEGAFLDGRRRGETVWEGVDALRRALIEPVPSSAMTAGLRHLLPAAGPSAAKRWMLFLRWMVRSDDGVDMGLWTGIPPSALIVPLDRHLLAFARDFGWTRRRAPDRRAAEEVTAVLRQFDAQDPLRYDFALCHLGISGRCRHRRDRRLCRTCSLRKGCKKGAPRVTLGFPDSLPFK